MQVSDPTTEQLTLTPGQVRLIFASLMTAMALSALDGTIVNTALLTIVDDLGGLKSYTWVGTSYLVCSTIATMLLGKLSDLFGRRRLYLFALVVFLIGSALCGFATTMMQLVLARGLQGVGGGGIISLSFAVVADLVSPRERGKYSSMFTSVFAIGGVVGPLVGGLIVQHSSWRWIFWVNLPLGAVALVLAFKVLHVPYVRTGRRVDVTGSLLMTIGVAALLLGCSWAPSDHGWNSPVTISLLLAAAVVFAMFVIWERRAVEPVMPLELFRLPVVRSMIVAAGAISICMFSANSFVPLFLQGVTGASPTNSGLLLAPLVMGVLLGATLTGRAIQRTGRYRTYAIEGFVIAVPAVIGMTFLGQGGLRLAALLVSMVALGYGVGMTNPISTMAIQNAVDSDDIGAASSLSMFFRQLVAAVGVALLGTLMSTRLSDRIDPALIREPRAIRRLPPAEKAVALDALSDAIRIVFVCCIPIAVIGLIAMIVTREVPLRTSARVGRSDEPVDGAALAH